MLGASNYPYIDASLNFVPNKKNAFGAVLHYSVWPPSSNYKSENIIQVSPFLWHTGNPLLKSHRSYDISINASSHAFVQISVAYTFGFGKQVKQGNDISRQSGASSGILK